MVICMPIHLAYNDSQFAGDAVNGTDVDLLLNHNYGQLVERTNSLLEDQIQYIYVVYGNRSISDKFNWTIARRKVLFKNMTCGDRACLARCFRVEIAITELKYKIKLPLLLFFIEFRSRNWEAYIIDRDQELTSGLVNFRGYYFIRKNVKLSSKESLKSNCKDYKELNCTSRRHCVDRCINVRFYEKHKSLPLYSVVDGDHFTSDSLAPIKFNRTRDGEIEQSCMNTYPQIDCRDVYFDESLELTTLFDSDHIYIKLDYENLVEKELEQPPMKVDVDILNLICIFFGLNATGLLSTLISGIKKFFSLKLFKILRIVIFISCFIAFAIHNVFVFNGIITGELIDSGYFKNIVKYRLPNSIFCIPFHKSEIDENYEITASYLDEVTVDLNFRNAFRKITYRNKTHLKSLTTSKLNLTKDSIFYSDAELELSHFYYGDLKCFEISLKTQFDEQDFTFENSKYVLQIYMNRAFIERFNKDVFFLYRDGDSRQIGGGFYWYISNFSDTDTYYSYNVEYRLFQIERDDHFEPLRKPSSLFYENTKNDARKYLDVMKQNFKRKFNLTSRDSLLVGDDLQTTIDDNLFEQYYLQVQNITDYANQTSSNYRQNVYNLYTQPLYRNNYSFEDFLFSHSLTSRYIKISNKENYTKLIISILNTLSLWLNISILELHVYMNKLKQPIDDFYRLLVGWRCYLVVKMKDQ